MATAIPRGLSSWAKLTLAAFRAALDILHPGFVQTQMVGFAGDISPQEASSRLITRIDELTLDNTGTFWHSNGETLPW